ncbi:unnamed protein product [Kuraishia capsulata CBS 1993]|uniref:Major facilitator superfamily (MFS) profile domain-containing protein n=1 Tax=Kuraishia capsulata CBS 1993 TaxID=1382522 RepID=W6MTY4_9ASCO|nr:uncharacterized protein KUCA_T00001284001 [Kuraishia capsulata CBS 1993]CDK25315.1 unnamed protein product [Kuraishia capsulata CBS 1993]
MPDSKEVNLISVDAENDLSSTSNSFDNGNDMDALGNDVVLDKKMFLINDAIDEIGFTWYQFKIFCLAGFGYSADSQLTLIPSTVQSFVQLQYNKEFPVSTEIAYAGLFAGALLWGISADLIGRRFAFNSSLFLGALFSFVVGGTSSYPMYQVFNFLSNLALGGNLALDISVYLEFLPFKHQWTTTLMAFWWGVGQTVCVLIAWAFLPKYSCSSADDCPSSSNRGWRYVWYVNSAIMMAGALARFFLVKLEETPKFLVSNNRDEDAVACLHRIATKYNRPCSLTLEQLTECGTIKSNKSFNYTWKGGIQLMNHHFALLFPNKVSSWSTFLNFFSWFGIGITYGLFSNFLPYFLSSRGAQTSNGSVYQTYRDNTIANFVCLFGPIIAAGLIFIPKVGRRGTMAIGGILSMIFLFCYTTVRTEPQNVAFSSITYLCIYVYYGCLYAYTPEVMPSAARGTGASVAMVFNRLAGLIVPLIAYYGDTSSSVPIWVCGTFIGVIGLLAITFPFEPTTMRSV